MPPCCRYYLRFGLFPLRTQFFPVLPALLFSLLFLLPTWYLWRSDRRLWASLPFAICLILLGFTCAIQLAIVNRTQAANDLEVLLDELPREELFVRTDLSDPDQMLFLASAGSQALFSGREAGDTIRYRIDTALAFLAERVTDRKLFPRWNRSRDWDLEVFFLAHAGAVLAHYQLATGDADTYGRDLQSIGEYLGSRLRRGRYKHLISRPGEEFFRPADNAAALYTLSLYDRITGADQFPPAFSDWTDYLKDELYFAESRLPCAAFNITDRCQLEPSATATGLYIAYRAAAAPDRVEDNIPWKEWTHYFRRHNFSPFTVSIRHNMRADEPTRSCDQGAQPLECRRFEQAIGLWAAAEYDGEYTFFRLFSSVVFRRWFGSQVNYSAMSSTQRSIELCKLAIQTTGEWRAGR